MKDDKKTDPESSGSEDENEPQIPARENAELLPNVETSATTITGCADAELKNFKATTDFVCRQVSVQLADLWKEICSTAQKNGEDGEKAAKVSVSCKLEIDHSNINLMDTKVTTSFSEKHTAAAEIQEDLTQTEFALP